MNVFKYLPAASVIVLLLLSCNENDTSCSHIQGKFGNPISIDSLNIEKLDLQQLTLLGFYNECSLRYFSDTSHQYIPSNKKIPKNKDLHAVDAKPKILQLAKDKDILILNEAHDLAYPRIFATNLLEELKNYGYSMLALETLDYRDSLINQRKVPLRSSGVYSKEPIFGDLLRQALNQGYQLIPYECVRTDSIPDSCGGRNRELAMAKNIDQALEGHPGEKMIIICGYGHGSYDDDLMGGILKSLDKYKILSVDQISLCTELSSDLQSHLRDSIGHLHQASIIKDDADSIFHIEPELYDMEVIYPAYSYSNDKRPEWIRNLKSRQNYKSGRELDGFGCTIAYLEDEYDQYQCESIPMDIQWHESGERYIDLYLPKGMYYIFEINKAQHRKRLISIE